MVGYKDTSDVAKKAAELAHTKKSNNLPIVSCIHNGSEITTWMGIASKPKAQNPKQHF